MNISLNLTLSLSCLSPHFSHFLQNHFSTSSWSTGNKLNKKKTHYGGDISVVTCSTSYLQSCPQAHWQRQENTSCLVNLNIFCMRSRTYFSAHRPEFGFIPGATFCSVLNTIQQLQRQTFQSNKPLRDTFLL